MPSLLDIAPPELSAETIDIRGTSLKVCGIGADAWAVLYSRHPDLRAIVTGRTEGLSPISMFAAQAALIAAGLGSLGDVEIERAVMSRLTADEAGTIAAMIVRLSMPGHVFAPLLEAVAKDAAAEYGKEVVTK